MAPRSNRTGNLQHARMGLLVLLVATSLGSFADEARGQILVTEGSAISFIANSSDPGVGMSWTDPAFVDSAWTAGSYGIGFDNSGSAADLITTSVPSGTVSIYTRANFTVIDPASLPNLFLGCDYDDGAVAWINGVEVWRSPSMPGGNLSWNTSPSGHESSNGSSPSFGPLIDVTSSGLPLLQAGTNTITVGVWNTSSTSSDLVVVPYLGVGFAAPVDIVRQPYLQSATESSIVVKWRTSAPTDSRVIFGASPTSLTDSAIDTASVSNHSVTLSGLTPNTTYFYGVGSTSAVAAGGGLDHFFTTAPAATAPTRLWIIGDSGTADGNAAAVRDAYLSYTATNPADLWLMLGDNAYTSGTDSQYQQAVFDMYPSILRTTPLWSTLGNHDGYSADSGSESGVYYDVFSLPSAGQGGGLPSGTEAYYAFDWSNIHFVCLNSYDVNRSTSGAMLTWLEADLAATTQEWIVAFWHHPPYTKGSHDSDSESRHVDMRQNALPILEDYGVDLVLGGHSHSYERSFFLDGHYGPSGSFGGGMMVDGGDGNESGDGAYTKSGGLIAHQGAVYAVVGSSGKTSGGSLDHPAMYISVSQLGSMVLDIDGSRLDAVFIDDNGSVVDEFTILKGPTGPTGPTFSRGDVNDDGGINLSDVVAILETLFLGATFLDNCPDSGDANDDGAVNITDAVAILDYLFNGMTIEPPFSCGADPTADALDCGPTSCP